VGQSNITILSRFSAIAFLAVIACGMKFSGQGGLGLAVSATESIFIVKHTWHTGIIFERNKAYEFIPVLEGIFPAAEFLEIGWGDKDFFTSEKGTSGLALKAALWTTKSVLLVSPYYRDPSAFFKDTDLEKIQLTTEEFSNICSYINRSFAIDGENKLIMVKSESNVSGGFYLSSEKYHIFKTCNVWTARALKKAGLPIFPFFALRSENVLKQVKRRCNQQPVQRIRVR